jgi:hypothetical protein
MESSPHATPEHLRAQAALLGIHPTDTDLADVRGFLEAILPALAEIERRLPPSAGGGHDVPEEGSS